MSKLLSALVGICLWLIIIGNALAVDAHTYIPAKAKQVVPIMVVQQRLWFPEIVAPWYFGGLGEQESCGSLTSPKCYDANATLASPRELGKGIPQFTKAYRADGSIRFDALTELVRKHDDALHDLSWSNVSQRVDLQVRGMMLLSRDNYMRLGYIHDEDERINFMDAAYNGGLGGVIEQRRRCGLMSRCDPQIWFDNVADICAKSLKPLYGNRNACQINTEHVALIRHVRMDKYKVFWDGN